MYLASFLIWVSGSDLCTRSEPARSTRCSFDVKTRSEPRSRPSNAKVKMQWEREEVWFMGVDEIFLM